MTVCVAGGGAKEVGFFFSFPLFATGTVQAHGPDGFSHQHLEEAACSVCLASVTITGLTAGVPLYFAAVLHGAVIGHLHRFPNVGFPAL